MYEKNLPVPWIRHGRWFAAKKTSATQNLWCHVKALSLTFPFKDFSICSRTLLAIPIIFKNTVSHICIYLLEKLHFPSFEPKMFETFFCTICVCVPSLKNWTESTLKEKWPVGQSGPMPPFVACIARPRQTRRGYWRNFQHCAEQTSKRRVPMVWIHGTNVVGVLP